MWCARARRRRRWPRTMWGSRMSDRAWLQGMLDFEAALARVTAPADAAAAIAAVCSAADYDVAALAAEAPATGPPVVPLLAAMRARLPEGAREHLHRGATSQDVVDTAAM